MLHADERLSDQAAVLITSKSNRCVCVLALMDGRAAVLQRGPGSTPLSLITSDDKTQPWKYAKTLPK